jgi:ribose 5-phosphate isomerase B
VRVHIGADHRGRELAESLGVRLREQGHDVALEAPREGETCDYPESAAVVGRAVAGGEAALGILLCGTGVGMSIAANKIRGVRAALAHDELTAELSRSHNDANVLCLSADLLGQRLVEKIVDRFLQTGFAGGRHARRVAKIEALEQGRDLHEIEG